MVPSLKPPPPRNLCLTLALAGLAKGELRPNHFQTVVNEALAMEKALAFYANPANYLDGVPLLPDDTNLLSLPDEGLTASWALHLVDLGGDPLVEDMAQGGALTEAGDGGEGGSQQPELVGPKLEDPPQIVVFH